jgi:hypothetical protein
MDKPINSNHVRNALQNIYQTHQFEHIGVHRFDANNPDHYQSNRVIQFKLPETDEPYLIVVRPVLRSGDYILDFSKCYTAFTGYYNPIIVPPQSHHRALRYNIFENSMKIDKLWLK